MEKLIYAYFLLSVLSVLAHHLNLTFINRNVKNKTAAPISLFAIKVNLI